VCGDGKVQMTKRSEIKQCNSVIVKLGSALITREDEKGLALGRLGALVEQMAEAHRSDKKVMLVTSGAVAFGKQLLMAQSNMSQPLNKTFQKQSDGAYVLLPKGAPPSVILETPHDSVCSELILHKMCGEGFLLQICNTKAMQLTLPPCFTATRPRPFAGRSLTHGLAVQLDKVV
jgi:hypothetical protein